MTELFLYDAIDQGSARAFIDQLKTHKGPLTIRINSGGGSVFEGLAIYNAIKRHGRATIIIDGLAASIASAIAMAGTRVEMARNALMMIHNPWSGSSGDSADLRKQADLLDKVKASMIQAYGSRTGKPPDVIAAIMDAETWYTAEEALEHKFIDGIVEPLHLAAHYIGLEKFNLPDRIKVMTTQTTQPNLDPEIEAKLAELDAIKAEQKRVGDITARCAGVIRKYPDLGLDRVLADCLSDPSISVQAAVDRLMIEMGKASSPTASYYAYAARVSPESGRLEYGPNNHHQEFLSAAIDALMIKNQIKPKTPHPAAHDLLGMSLTDMARTMIGQAGGTIRRGLFGIKSETANDVIKAALTTSDFPLLLENVASKSLMNGYDSEPATHRAWVNQTDVADFKAQKRVALSEAPNLELINERGEYTHGKLKEKGEAFALQTFGKMINLSRQMMINDDLNALTKIPNALGRSAARLEADKVYAILTGNPAMADGVPLFHATHNNLMPAAALSIDSLAMARASMRKQRGLQNAILNIVPRFLIVPAALESTAEQMVASLVDPTKANETPQHAWIRGLDIVVDARLDENSEAAWYLAADFHQVDTIEIAYLQGQRGAFIDQEQDFDTDALKIKCRLDFQAAPIDWIGLVRNPGA